MKKSSIFICMSIAIIFASCAISINKTKHSEQPWIGNPFDLSRTDYKVIRPVTSVFTATYVLGIGGWNSIRRNAIEEICAMADVSKNQPVVNITNRTFVNFVLGVFIVKRETEARGLLIEFITADNSNTQIQLAPNIATNTNTNDNANKQIQLEPEVTTSANTNANDNAKQPLVPKMSNKQQKLDINQQKIVNNPSNKFYLAYLYKTKQLKYFDEELSKMFDFNFIKQTAKDYPEKALDKKMVGYDRYLEKYKVK